MSKIDRETALTWFSQWADDNGLDFDTSLMDDEDKTNFEKQKERVIKGVMQGAVTFNDDGEIVLEPQNKKSGYQEKLTFGEVTGAALVSMDRKKRGQDMGKTYVTMGEMCGVPAGTFSRLVGVDIKRAQAIFVLLMD